jgi:integrase
MAERGVEPIDPKEQTLAQSAQAYIRDAKGRQANKAAYQAEIVTAEFLRLIKKTHLHQITREDILRYHDSLRKRGASDRTIANKHARLKSWLRFVGAEDEIFPPAPKYEKKLPTVYTGEQIAAILAAADPYTKLVIGLALKCGLREQELVFLEWSHIGEHDGVLRVQGKDHYGFKVKDSEQREIPIPDDLLEELMARKAKHKKQRLVLCTATGEPNEKLLRALKRLAQRATLNCNRCDGCNGKLKEWREWTLHRFRRTFCTTLLRSGVDLRNVQALAGHEDLDSTLRNLRPATGTQLKTRINSVEWGA